MEKKTYKYNNNLYRLKPITLQVLAGAAPMLAKFRKLQKKYTCDIDMSAVDSARERIAELEISIEQLEDEAENAAGNETRITQLKTKLKCAKDEFDNDTKIRAAVTLYNECFALAMLELIGDRGVVKSFLSAALETDNGQCFDDEIDLNSANALEFVKDAVHDFFYSIAAREKSSNG